MHNKQLWVVAVAGFIGLAALVKVQARSPIEAHDGTARFNVTFAPEAVLFIGGKAADAIWKSMHSVPVTPAAPDLESRKPENVSLSDLERKHGTDIHCHKIPLHGEGGFVRAPDGKLITNIHCTFEIKNIAAGQLK